MIRNTPSCRKRRRVVSKVLLWLWRLLLLLPVVQAALLDYLVIYEVGYKRGDTFDVIGFSVIFGFITLCQAAFPMMHWNDFLRVNQEKTTCRLPA